MDFFSSDIMETPYLNDQRKQVAAFCACTSGAKNKCTRDTSLLVDRCQSNTRVIYIAFAFGGTASTGSAEMMKDITCIAAVILACALSACSDKDKPADQSSAAPSSEAAVQQQTAAPVDEHIQAGESVYKKACSICHASGVGGAPIAGNKDEWGPRIAQGEDTLFKHALEGFTGEKGIMLPKGGFANLSDDEVKNGVLYMVSRAK